MGARRFGAQMVYLALWSTVLHGVAAAGVPGERGQPTGASPSTVVATTTGMLILAVLREQGRHARRRRPVGPATTTRHRGEPR